MIDPQILAKLYRGIDPEKNKEELILNQPHIKALLAVYDKGWCDGYERAIDACDEGLFG